MLERLTKDWPLKLLALGLAFAVWVAITGEDRIPVNLDVALDPQLRSDHILAVNPPTQVKVRLVGPESVVRTLNGRNLALRVDLTSMPTGEREVQLTADELKGKPERVEVEFFEPDRVRFVIDDRRRRQLPVVAKLTGEPAPGYTLYHTRLRPDRVVVEGPAAEIEKMEHVSTDPITIDQRSRRFIVERVNPVPGRPNVRIVDPRPIEVRVDIDASPVDRVIERVPVSASGTPRADYDVRPDSARVTVAGPPAVVEMLKPEQIRVIADLEGLEPAPEPQRVRLAAVLVDVPPDQMTRVQVKAVDPQTVRVRVTERRSDS